MSERIKQHQAQRGNDWALVEEPINLTKILPQYANENTCVLVDCLTLWVTNLMMQNRDVDTECDRLVECLKALPASSQIILVSNEGGQGIVPMEKMARDFRDHAGRLHQKCAAAANHVWFITAGLPQKLK
jgi:adenosylcobinamide kinase/adenosylcobinamide-phosphate guanylyltransferase